MRRLWNSLSVSSKLYAVVGIMAFLIAIELFTLLFAMKTQSAVRAFVGGEGIWSKAQKDAVLQIKTYARTFDERDYLKFKTHLEIPLGDHRARIEMQKSDMNMDVVREGFLAGNIHPDDIEPMVKLMTRFYMVPYIAKAIEIWGRGDELMFRLVEVSSQLHKVVETSRGTPDLNLIQAYLDQIFLLNEQLTELENEFSFTLGEGSRWLEHLLMILLVIMVATVEGTGLLLTFKFSRNLTRVLHELSDFATRVGSGDFSKTVPVRTSDELGQLAGALNKMTSELKEITSERQVADRANQIKSLFLANMSHEIRTPLNAILGFVDLLKSPALPFPKRKQYLEIIERTGSSLATIINDILDISKVEAGKLEIEKTVCQTNRILSDLETLLSLRCAEKGIELKVQREFLPPFVVTDATRFKQILLNVIGNAIKFTSRGLVTVKFEVRGLMLLCTVKDTGVGMDSDGVEKLFQPFSQGDLSISKRYGGTGLGLVLSKKLAGLLGGDVVLEHSELGRGSTFVVSISLEESQYIPIPDLDSARAAKELRSLQGKRILVAEDSLDNQLLAQEYLELEGANVQLVNNGGEAVEAVSKADYDLVLMDMQMPIMDGYTATAELRKKGCSTPIIALTAHAMKEDLQKCLGAGCNGYLAKPFRRDNLMEVLSAYFPSAV